MQYVEAFLSPFLVAQVVVNRAFQGRQLCQAGVHVAFGQPTVFDYLERFPVLRQGFPRPPVFILVNQDIHLIEVAHENVVSHVHARFGFPCLLEECYAVVEFLECLFHGAELHLHQSHVHGEIRLCFHIAVLPR